MTSDIDRCLDCPKIIIRPAKWRVMSERQKRDPRFSKAIAKRCRACYQRHRRKWATLMAERKAARPRRARTLCGCGCLIWVGEDCPQCKYELLTKANAA